MHILFLSDNFPPEVNAPASRTFEHAKTWAKEGHTITVITCFPNFPKGKIFSGYKNRLYLKEEIEGINVVRVWSFISSNKGIVLRMIDHISYMISSIIASLFIKKCDVIVATSPQFFTAVGGSIISFLKRKPWVFEIRDIWSESIIAVGLLTDSIFIKIIERLELFLYKNAAHIIVVTHDFARILNLKGIDSKKIDVVTNGSDLTKFKKIPKNIDLIKKYNLQDSFVVGYIGTHGMAHSLETILDSAKIIEDRGIENVTFLFLGDGARKSDLISYSKRLHLKNTIFLDTVPRSEILLYWSILDLSIIHLKDSNAFRSVIPSKLFECMAMGIPVLHGVYGESQDIVLKNSIGLAFQSENSTDLANKLMQVQANKSLLKDFSKNGILSSLKYDRHNLALSMLDILKSKVII